MNTIKIDGLVDGYPEPIDGTSEWYYSQKGTDDFLDLYEAEEIVKDGHAFGGMNCHLIHFPDGEVFSPFELRENFYVEAPVWDDGKFYFLCVDFSKKTIQIYCYYPEDKKLELIEKLPLDCVKDCYNLKLNVSPLMLGRDANECVFQIIWPEKISFSIGSTESLMFRDGDYLYFSEWHEDPDYHEYVIIRDFHTGEIKDKFSGTICRMPNGVFWRF